MDSSRFVRIFAFWAAALQRAAVLSGAAALCCAATAAQPDQAPWEELRGDLTRLNAALADSSPPALDGLLDEWAGRRVDHEGFTRTVFRDYCARTLKGYGKFMSGKELDDFVALHEERLQKEFRAHWVSALAAYLREGPLTSLRLVEIDDRGDEAEVEIAAETGPGGEPRTLILQLRAGPDWRLVDVETGGRSASDLMRGRFEEILKKEYSLPVLEARMRQRPYVVLEDFSATEPGRPPEGWGWRNKDRDKPKPYTVLAAGSHHYLAARDSGSSIILLKVSHWNPRQYPILTWCWRAESLPPGGDERYGPTNDSAAGLYVFFSQNWLGIPRQIKYVWSSTLPEGTVDRRKRFARPWFFVVESGPGNLGSWVFEQVDLLADYDRVYGGEPKSRTRGLGILTDANSTHSYAEAHYADLRVWTREALERGEVRSHCECLPEPPVTGGRGPAASAAVEADPERP